MTETLEVHRTFDAPPELVWRAFTDPSAVPAWFWPFPTTAEVDARPGGRYLLTSAVLTMEGEVEAADAPRSLTLRWAWAGEPEQTRVRVDLAPDGAGTSLRVAHDGFATAEARDDHVKGWTDCLDRLPAWLAANA
ncbi:MAG TPA: SRPBCC domain-containing protein [Micromonosporaceae bacterium]|nr:SRPBCC domain-containing protein [Micromonosporaceae bacterium]